MKRIYITFITAFILAVMGSCQHPQSGPDKGSVPATLGGDFNAYWYQGKAELASYDLEQARYGEIHPGHAVLVFVTEDFSKKKQVKLDNPNKGGNDKVPIMKLNFTKKFNTGVYPYSMMQSVFTPIDQKAHPYSLKTTMSSQEWCGHTFTQLNRGKDNYLVKGFSYFESEGDTESTLPAVLLEDEIWNRIRIAPKSLPTGKQKVVPATFFSRLRHVTLKAEEAVLTLEEKGGETEYTLNYPGLNREISIQFETAFPHKILGWEDTYLSGFGPGAKKLTTRATLKKTLMSAYWKKHGVADAGMRGELGLE